MSNVGQGFAAVAGGVIGWFIGGPAGAAYGFQLGLAVGTLISPTQLPGVNGPRLNDTRTTQATVGAPVVEIFGVDSCPGTVMWLGPIRELPVTDEVGGKGAPEQNVTTYTYSQPIAIGLCRAPEGGVMGGILQIFENGKAVYDVRTQQEGESDTDYQNRLIVAAEYAETFTLYLGGEDQLPDPTIETFREPGTTPAFRGLMYIVYNDRLLQAEQGLRHPNFKFIVYDAGRTECADVEFFSNEVLYPWDFLGSPTDVRNAYASYQYKYINSPTTTTLEAAKSDAEGEWGTLYNLVGWSMAPVESSDNPLGPIESVPDAEDALSLVYWYTRFSVPDSMNARALPCVIIPEDEDPGAGRWGLSSQVPRNHGIFYMGVVPGFSQTFNCGPYSVSAFYDVGVTVTRLVQGPVDPCLLYPPAPLPGYVMYEGSYLECGDWELDEQPYVALQIFNADGGLVDRYPLNPVRPVSHEDNNEAFWTAAYQYAVAQGLMPEGMTYPADYPSGMDYGYRRTANVCTVTTDQVSLARIVERICGRAGLAEINVSDLEEIYVIGYSIGRVMTARDAIEPLRLVGFFDVVESGRVLKFVTRGKAPVRTLAADDLGAHSYGEQSAPAVTTSKKQDVELPRKVRLHYRAPTRDYEDGEQISPSRLSTAAVNDSDVECAVAITDEMAAQSAEVLWADAWAGRWTHGLALDRSHLDLEPADVVLVPVDNRLERIRIQGMSSVLGLIQRIEAVRDDDGSYVSVAIADPPVRTPGVIVVYAQTLLTFLDLPALRVEDNDPGFYVAAMRSGSGTTWRGASIMRTTDGSTYQSLASVANEATIGTLTAPLPAGPRTIWDDGNEILVTLSAGQSLSSRPDDEVLDGANALAIGAHGRWEIVQFANAELVGANQWRLTRLLRGRRGTEHGIGTSQVSDRAVLISGPGIVRIPLTIAEVGVPLTYRSVTLGTSVASGTDAPFTGEGEALKPFAPVHVEAERNEDGDIAITWTRRDRLLITYEPGEATPLSETTEDYEVDVLDGSDAIRRTISTSTPSVTYGADQQVTDFGALQPAIDVVIYQTSAAIGRGHGTRVTL